MGRSFKDYLDGAMYFLLDTTDKARKTVYRCNQDVPNTAVFEDRQHVQPVFRGFIGSQSNT